MSELSSLKLIIVGDEGVGKSTFLRRHQDGEFLSEHYPNESVSLVNLNFSSTRGDVSFQCWDMPGAESADSNQAHRVGWSQGANAAIIMFDVMRESTYESVRRWYEEIIEAVGVIPIVLVGTHVDCKERAVQPKSITFHREKNLQYYDVSTKSNYNFDKPFLWLARRIASDPTLDFF